MTEIKMDRVIAVRTSKTVYRSGDSAVKVFDEGYSKADVLNEALNHARVEQTGLNVPKLLEVTTIDGRWAIVTEFIKGKTLEKLMADNPDRLAQYMEQLVDLQIEVFAHKAPSLANLKSKMNRKISMTAELDATARYELHTRLDSMPDHDKVCHGDFNPSNIIVPASGPAYILDWSHATQGNAAADVAMTYLWFWLNGDIKGAEMYLDLYCRKSDTARQYIQKWMPLVAAAHLAESRPEQQEFLKSWIDVVDYQ